MTLGLHRLATLSALGIASSSLHACGSAAASGDPDPFIAAASTDRQELRAGRTVAVHEGAGGAAASIWIDDQLVPERRDGAEVLALHGATTGHLSGGAALAGDRPYGTFRPLSSHAFEVTWPRDELGPLAFGVDQLVRLDLRRGRDHTRPVFVRVLAEPRLEDSGDGSLAPSVRARPVLVAGRTVVRLAGRASEKLYDLHVLAGGSAWVPRRLLGDTAFEADLTADQALALVGSPTDVVFESRFLAGPAVDRARLGLSVGRVDATADDPHEVFGEPTCTADIRSCLAALPPGALDLGSCGSAREVSACAGELGSRVAREDVEAAVARAHALVEDPKGFAGDALALVGAGRLGTFVAAVDRAAARRLQEMAGLWQVSPASVTAALDAEIAAVLDEAYATPLRLAPTLAPVPGDLQRERDLAADALLSYLAGFDFVHSELDRPLVEIVAQYRQAHVAALGALRQDAMPDANAGEGRYDVFVGSWLSPYVEIWVDRTTGAVDHVLLEID